MGGSNVVIKVLGTAQDGGVPQVGCTCEHCKVIETRPELKRLAASLAIILPEAEKWYLVDATPDMREQLGFIKKDYPNLGLMDSVLLTHAHIGHYPGLMFLGKEVISTKGLPVYTGEEMGEFLMNHAPWKQLVELKNINIQSIYPNETFYFDNEVRIVPFEVPHRNEYSKTFGMIISGKEKRLLYIPDIDRWEQWDMDLREVVTKVDYCLLDGTFFSESELAVSGRDYKEIPHPLISITMNLLKDVAQRGNTEIYFTHLNHTNPAVDPKSQVTTMIENNGFYVAQEGMSIIL